ncbi:MAG: UPF0104 family protein [Caldilineae bacterium]|nr:MAG: UPF0104 family protein [Caldilineae bacterium]
MPAFAKTLLKIAVSVGLILLLLSKIDTAAIGRQLAAADLRWTLATTALFIVSILLRTVRWKILLDAQGVRVPYLRLSRWYYIGAFFNTLLPTGFGGDVVRTVELAQYSRQTPSAVGTVLLDRFLGILVLLGLGVVAIPLSRADIPMSLYAVVVALFVLAAGGFALLRQQRLVMYLRDRLLGLLPGALRSRVERLTWFRPLYMALQGYERRILFTALAASLIFNFDWILINMLAGLAVGIRLPAADYLVLVPLVSLALLLPSFGGVGVRELSYVGLFGQLGVPGETAFAMSLIVYAATVVTGLVGGLLLLEQTLRPQPTSRPEPEL